jgi:hypothetical protein
MSTITVDTVIDLTDSTQELLWWRAQALAVASCPSDRARLVRRLADLDALRAAGCNPQRAALMLL